MGTVSGGQLAVEALIERGVTKVFSLCGGHINPLYESAEGSSLEIFTTRHEQAAVFMAEAWGRLTRKPGVALVTAGPGFSNGLWASLTQDRRSVEVARPTRHFPSGPNPV